MDRGNISLMDFSDCLLLNLLKYLDSTSLFNLSRVNKRFENLVLDSCLWRQIDARDGPMSKAKNAYCLKRVNKATSVLCLKGGTVTTPMLIQLQLIKFSHNLTVLALENQNIKEAVISLNNFPSTLVELSFRNSSIANSSYFFRRTFERMGDLQVLLLDGCSLINSSVVMSVSKYPNLEILSFYKCEIENSIPYFSIAAMHGFKNLKVLDVRLSGLGNLFLSSMIRSKQLTSFYFQNMDTSYALDFKTREFELLAKGHKNLVPEVAFTILNTTGNDDTLITDNGTMEFKRTVPINTVCDLPPSYLYKDPFEPCTCGYLDSYDLGSIEPEEPANPDEEVHDFLVSEPLEIHLNLVHAVKERYQIKEYPVDVNKDKNNSVDGETHFLRNSRMRQPLRKRKLHPDHPHQLVYPPRAVVNNFVANPEAPRAGGQVPRCSSQDVQVSICNNPPALNGYTDEGPLKKFKCNKDDRGSLDESTSTISNGGTPSNSQSNISGCTENSLESDDKQTSRSKALEKSDQSDGDDSDKPDDSCGCPNLSNGVKHEDSEIEAAKPSRNNLVPSTSRHLECSRNSRCDSDDEENPSTSNGTRKRKKSCNETNDDDDDETPRTPRPRLQPEDRRRTTLRCSKTVRLNYRDIWQICINERRNPSSAVCVRNPNESRNPFPDQEHNPDQGHDVPLVNVINLVIPQRGYERDAVIPPDFAIINRNMNQVNELSLRRLSLRGYSRVTDLTLSRLEHLNLELLDVTYTKVTKGGIQAFLRMNPNCRVLHKDFCVCRPKLHF